MNIAIAALLLLLQIPATAPRIQGFSVQGTSVNLDFYKGKSNVLVVFYRTEA